MAQFLYFNCRKEFDAIARANAQGLEKPSIDDQWNVVRLEAEN